MVGIAQPDGTSSRRVSTRIVSLAAAGILVTAVLWSAELPIAGLLAFTFTSQAAKDGVVDSNHDRNEPSGSTVRNIADPAATNLSSSPLRLITTLPGRNVREGSAELRETPDSVRTYLAGALLSDGTRLVEVHRDSVVLMRGGETWTIRPGELPQETNAPGGTTEVPPSISDQSGTSSGGDSLTHDSLTDLVRPTPVYDQTEGTLLGYEVHPGVNQRAFEQMGLEPGDLILAINHAPVNEPAALDLLRQLTRGVAVTATVQRKGIPQEIALNGAVPSGDDVAGTPEHASRKTSS